MTMTVKVFLTLLAINILASILLPTGLSILVLYGSVRFTERPISIAWSLLHMRALLRDAVSQFSYHRRAFDTALSLLQEQIFLL